MCGDKTGNVTRLGGRKSREHLATAGEAYQRDTTELVCNRCAAVSPIITETLSNRYAWRCFSCNWINDISVELRGKVDKLAVASTPAPDHLCDCGTSQIQLVGGDFVCPRCEHNNGPLRDPPPTEPTIRYLDTGTNMSADQVLGLSREQELTDVIVIGYDKDDDFIVSVSSTTNENALWMMEMALKRFWKNILKT